MASDKKNRRLQELRGSDFEISEGQPDIRGWEVLDTEARKIGRVKELIFDVRDRKVRYMAIDVAHNKELQLEDRLVLVPIGLAQLDHPNDDVILQNVTPFQLRALPRYDDDLLGAQVERDISMVFGREFTGSGSNTATGSGSNTAAMAGTGAAGLAGASTGSFSNENDVDADFYKHEFFNDQNMYRNRPENTRTESPSNQEYFGNENTRRNNESETERQSESLAASDKRHYDDKDEDRIRKEVREKDREAAMLAATDKRNRDYDDEERLRKDRDQERQSESLAASDKRHYDDIDEDRIRKEVREKDREAAMLAAADKRNRDYDDEERLRKDRDQERQSERLTASDNRDSINEDRIREEERIREDERRKIREEESLRAGRLERQRNETDEEYLRRIKKDLEDNKR